jgi:hypothetical protein
VRNPSPKYLRAAPLRANPHHAGRYRSTALVLNRREKLRCSLRALKPVPCRRRTQNKSF